MTVSSQTSSETYLGNGVTTIWDLPFRFFENSDIQVYLTDPSTNTTTLLVLGTDYTLFGAGLPEQFGTAPGKITTTVPVPVTWVLEVSRVMPIEQLTDIINQGDFFPEIHEDVFDRLTMMMQQTDFGVQRALRMPVGQNYYDALGHQIKNLGDPTAPQDAATKNYVDIADSDLQSQIDSLSAGLPGTNYAFPWSTTTTQSTKTLTPGFTFASATLAINGATQSYGRSYTVENNQILLAEAIPAGTEVSAILGQNVVPTPPDVEPFTVSSYAELRAYIGSANSLSLVDGFRSGRFRVVSQNPTGYTDDGGITIIAANGLVWQRINVGEVHVDWYLPQSWVEGVTDDTVYFQRACNYRRSNGGGTVRYFRRHLIDNNLYVVDYVYLRGALEDAEELLDGVQAYSSKASTLILNPSRSIFLESGSSHSHGLVIPKGMTLRFPDEAAAIAGVASFAGTAFKARGAGVYLHDTTIWGFDLAFSSVSLERARVERVKGDCNNGIYIEACYDIADVSNCHFWPWLTTHRGFTSSVNLRPGTAYKFVNVGDWNRLSRNFSFGYNRGFVIDSCDNVELVNCGADWIGSLANTTSIGFEITGTSRNTTMTACQAAAQWRGVFMNSTADKGRLLQLNGCQFWDNDGAHIKNSGGFVQAVGNSLRGGAVGFDFDSSSLGGNITVNTFDGVTTPVTGTLTDVQSSGNNYVGCIDAVLGDRKVLTGQNGNSIDALYNPINSRNHITRRAGGTSSAPTALAGSASVVAYSASAHNGSAFSVIAGIRMQTSQAQTPTSSGGTIVFSNCADGSTSVQDRWVMTNDGAFRPIGNATQDLAGPSNRINNSYFAVAPTVGSDERYKTTPQAIPDIVLDAWAAVEYQQYKLLQAVEEKGEDNARLHVGLIAQRVVEAFASFGLDAHDYGLLCRDSWEATPAVEEVRDEEGTVIVPGREAVSADDRYSIRYEEALAMEAALMRRELKKIQAKIGVI